MPDLQHLPQPHAIIFDWDHTLADNWSAVTAALNAAFRAYQLPEMTATEAYQTAYQSLRDAFPRWFGEHAAAATKLFYEHFSAHHLSHLVPMPAATELLSMLSSLPLQRGIISNKQHRLLLAELAQLGWQDYFHYSMGAGLASHDKPHPAMMEHWRQQQQLSSTAPVWYVGDRPGDVEFAKATGAAPILLGDYQPADWPNVSCFRDLPAFVSALDKVRHLWQF